MSPAGTVRLSGPSVKPCSNAFVRSRISSAFGMFDSRLRQRVLQHLDEVFSGESGLEAFANGVADELAGALGFHLAAAVVRHVGDERPESLPAIDQAVALQLFVGALD